MDNILILKIFIKWAKKEGIYLKYTKQSKKFSSLLKDDYFKLRRMDMLSVITSLLYDSEIFTLWVNTNEGGVFWINKYIKWLLFCYHCNIITKYDLFSSFVVKDFLMFKHSIEKKIFNELWLLKNK